ncbi:MAG: hypothetical protein ACFFA3_07420 [Promethearchaeota archaeon]
MARNWSRKINLKKNPIKIDIAKIIPAGIRKYQKCSSKNDSSLWSSHSSSQKDDEHSIVVIDYHLCKSYISFN